MRALIKIISINILVFFLLLVVAEMGFRFIGTFYKFPKKFRNQYVTGPTAKDKSEWQNIHPGFVLRPIPEKYQYSPPPELLNHQGYSSEKVLSERTGPSQEKPSVTHSRVTTANGGPVIYEVDYFKDPYGRRYVENQGRKKNTNKFVLAFGCSFTFGEGLPQGLDYPSQLAAKLDSSWKVYNFGSPGFGINDVLERFDKEVHYSEGIKEEEGVFIWLMLDNHMLRTLCTWDCYVDHYDWILSKPEYELRDGQYVTRSSFRDSSSPKRMFYSVLAKNRLIQRFGFRENPRWSEEDFETAIQMLDQVTRLMKGKRFKKKYVVIEDNMSSPVFRTLLVQYGFEPIDFYNALSIFPPKYARIPIDNHPTAEHNWLLSEILAWHINKDWQN